MKSRTLFSALLACAFLVAASSPTHAIVSQWDLDQAPGTAGVGTVLDSAGSNDANTVNTTSFTGTHLRLNGTGHVTAPASASLNASSFTMSAWAKVNANVPTGGGNYLAVVTSRLNGPPQEGYILYRDNANRWSFWTGDGPGGVAWAQLNGGQAKRGEWQHLAIAYDSGTSTKTLYVDGAVAATSGAQGFDPQVSNGFHIGGGADSGNSFQFKGSINDVRYFDSALSLGDVQNIMAENGAQDISKGKSYSYSVLPTFSGGLYYKDDAHVQSVNVFDTGDLTDGLVFSGTPTVPPVNGLVGWGDPASISTEIIIDLEGLYDVSSLDLGTHLWSPFANGAPNDVTISFSDSGLAAGDFGSSIFQAFAHPSGNGHHDLFVQANGTSARYVKLSFDGGATSGNKWMLDEITVYGAATAPPVPEPATVTLGLISVLALARRRRKNV